MVQHSLSYRRIECATDFSTLSPYVIYPKSGIYLIIILIIIIIIIIINFIFRG